MVCKHTVIWSAALCGIALIGGALVASCGSSSGSSSGSTPPAASSGPASLTATPGNSQVSLSWTAVSGAASYNVYRSTVSGFTASPSDKVNTGTVVTASYTDSSVTPDTTYYYLVTASIAGVETAPSPQASVTPGPYNLTYTLNGYEAPHGGQTVKMALVNPPSTIFAVKTATVPTSGTAGVTFTFNAMLLPGSSYYVDYYADVDADNACTPNFDHIWRDSTAAANVTGDVTASFTHNTNFTEIVCNDTPSF